MKNEMMKWNTDGRPETNTTGELSVVSPDTTVNVDGPPTQSRRKMDSKTIL